LVPAAEEELEPVPKSQQTEVNQRPPTPGSQDRGLEREQATGCPMSRELTVWFNSPDQGNPEKNKEEKCQTTSKQSIKSNYNKQE